MELLINIDVPDLVAAERFYTQAFALRPGRRLAGGILELLGAAVPIYLLERAAGSAANASAERTYARHWTPVHLDLVVNDIEAARARALRAGACAEAELTCDVWGKMARLSDPFGHGICLIEFEAQGYDAIRVD